MKSIVTTALIACFLGLGVLQPQTVFAATPLTDQEMSDVTGGDLPDAVQRVLSNLQSFTDGQNDQVSPDQISEHLQSQLNILGLRFDHLSITGITYGGVPLYIQINGTTVTTLQMPSHIDHIHGTLVVNGKSPQNHAFGDIDISDINLAGSSFTINMISANGTPSNWTVIPHH